MGKNYLFTSESVSEGHPDKMADYIADLVLDACLEQDSRSHVACEVLLSGNTAVVAGEITTRAEIDVRHIVHTVWPDCAIISRIQRQAPALRATASKGANDQGIIVGYACTDTPELMPLPIMLAHRLTKRLAEVRKAGTLPYLRADGKAQVTVAYDGEFPVDVCNVVLSTEHDEEVSIEQLRADVRRKVIDPVIIGEEVCAFINAQAGRFEVGGPVADSGLTGRKNVVDAYGPQVQIGGGSFSGKDPTKIDRSGAYMARHIAKAVVASGMAERVRIELAYCIGLKNPVAVSVDTFGTGDDADIAAFVRAFPLHTEGIIEYLGLRKPIYAGTTLYGHFGKPGLPWECVAKTKKPLALSA